MVTILKIHAHFDKMLDAKKAVEALRASGYNSAHLDMLEGLYEEEASELNIPGTDSAPSLSSLLLNSRDRLFNTEKNPLLAAGPMISGIGSFKEITGTSVCLLVNAETDRADDIKKIIKQFGGRFY